MKYYLAGPMRGYKEFNFPTFFAAAKKLRDEGHEVFDPAEHDVKQHGERVYKGLSGDLNEIPKDIEFNLAETLLADLTYIAREADGIALLPGWERSKGANAEYALTVALGKEVRYL